MAGVLTGSGWCSRGRNNSSGGCRSETPTTKVTWGLTSRFHSWSSTSLHTVTASRRPLARGDTVTRDSLRDSGQWPKPTVCVWCKAAHSPFLVPCIPLFLKGVAPTLAGMEQPNPDTVSQHELRNRNGTEAYVDQVSSGSRNRNECPPPSHLPPAPN